MCELGEIRMLHRVCGAKVESTKSEVGSQDSVGSMQLTLISRISTNSVLGHLELSPRAMVIERSRNELRGWPRNLLFESEVSAGMSFRNEVRNLSEVGSQAAVGIRQSTLMSRIRFFVISNECEKSTFKDLAMNEISPSSLRSSCRNDVRHSGWLAGIGLVRISQKLFFYLNLKP